MNTKWTPGPWVVVADESAAQVKGFPCIYANNYTIVGTEGMYGDIDTDFANAHLIAAAPDLYEALEFAMTIANGSIDPTSSNIELRSNLVRIRERSIAALAKARGE